MIESFYPYTTFFSNYTQLSFNSYLVIILIIVCTVNSIIYSIVPAYYQTKI